MKKKNLLLMITVAVIALIVLLSILFWNDIVAFVGPMLDTESIKAYLEDAGPWAPILFIGLQTLQVIIAPIPMQVIGLAGGYVFGALWGTIYSLIGLTFGSFIAIWLSRMFGRKLVIYFVNEETLEKFDHLAEKGGLLIFFLIFLLPALPDDAICFIAGLTPIPILSLVFVALLGRLPGLLALNLVGEQIRFSNSGMLTIIVITAVVIFLALAIIFKPQIEKLFMRKRRKKEVASPEISQSDAAGSNDSDVS